VLYDFLPGWNAIRTPGRLVTFSSLGLALLAAAGAEAAFRALRRRAAPAWAAPAVAGLLVLGIATEGRCLPFDPLDTMKQPAVPPAPVSTAGVPAPQLHLPGDDGR